MTSDPLSFEAAFASLEESVAILEQGGLTLEDALARFETGMQLAAQCEAMLNAAELRVTQLLAESDEAEEPPAF
jgi:exodeoxyribonuclease VII small subunit